MHLFSLDEHNITTTIDIPRTDRLNLAVVRVKDYSSKLSKTIWTYLKSVSEVRRNQFSSGRFAAQMCLNRRYKCRIPSIGADRRPDWPLDTVGSIAHSNSLAVALVGVKTDFRGLGVDILPKRAVSDKVRERILLDEEIKCVSDREDKDWQTMLFCAKESIYKASNPQTDEFLGFKDVCVNMNQSGTEYSAKTVSEKLSSELVARGQGYVFEIEEHWLTIFLIRPSS